jgi:hypothetical protein
MESVSDEVEVEANMERSQVAASTTSRKTKPSSRAQVGPLKLQTGEPEFILGYFHFFLDELPSCTSTTVIESISCCLGSMKQSDTTLKFHFWLETVDTQDSFLVRALLDSGADSCFINRSFVEKFNLTTHLLDEPIPVQNADGTHSQGGPITSFTDVILFAPPSFRDRLQLEVATLVYDVILGLPWLKRHNPPVNWKEGMMELLQDTTLTAVTADAEPQSSDAPLEPF